MTRMLLAALVGAATWLMPVATATAQAPAGAYPSRPVRIIVPQAAGSGIDLQARVIAQRLGEMWGQPGVVDNRAGANAIIGMEAGAKSAPDGYTLVYVPVSAVTANPFMYKSLPYDPVRDFAPVTQTVANPLGAVAHPASGIKSLADVVARAKAGQLHYGSFGIGNMTHLMGVLLATTGKVEMTHVPYRGQTPMIADVTSGQIPIAFTTMAGATDLVQAGKLTLLATFGEKRDPLFPDAPTPGEAGFPGVVMIGWAGMLAPTGTPPAIVTKLHADILKVLAMPDVQEAILKQGSRVVTSESPEAFARFIAAEQEKFRAVIRAAGLEGSQ